VGALNHLPIALATPRSSPITSNPKTAGRAGVAISQSGQSPDIISVAGGGKTTGMPDPGDYQRPRFPAGQCRRPGARYPGRAEKAVAATKTYTSELMMIAMLSVALDGDDDAWEQLGKVPALAEQMLKDDAAIQRTRSVSGI